MTYSSVVRNTQKETPTKLEVGQLILIKDEGTEKVLIVQQLINKSHTRAICKEATKTNSLQTVKDYGKKCAMISVSNRGDVYRPNKDSLDYILFKFKFKWRILSHDFDEIDINSLNEIPLNSL